MDNPVKWQHWVNKTQDKDKQNKNHNTDNKKMSNTYTTKNWG